MLRLVNQPGTSDDRRGYFEKASEFRTGNVMMGSDVILGISTSKSNEPLHIDHTDKGLLICDHGRVVDCVDEWFFEPNNSGNMVTHLVVILAKPKHMKYVDVNHGKIIYKDRKNGFLIAEGLDLRLAVTLKKPEEKILEFSINREFVEHPKIPS